MVQSALVGHWSVLTPPMKELRSLHSQTLLPTGRVLVAGGLDTAGECLATAEVFDLATRLWQATGSLSSQRHSHTATAIGLGKVLVAGGSGPEPLSSCEIFDLGKGSWQVVSTMKERRTGHTATMLRSGKVLVAGGVNELGNAVASAEVFDPIALSWTSTGPFSVARAFHAAVELASGRVLIIGGNGKTSVIDSVEEYDPDTNSWRTVGSLDEGRRDHTATILPSGQIVVAGGSGSAPALASVELSADNGATWTPGTALAQPRSGHSAVLLPGEKILVGGGVTLSGSPTETVDIYQSGDWTAGWPMEYPRAGHRTILLPDGWVMTSGGDDGDSEQELTTAELYESGAAPTCDVVSGDGTTTQVAEASPCGLCLTCSLDRSCGTPVAADRSCGICKICNGTIDGCTVTPVDDGQCGAIDCSGMSSPTCRYYPDRTIERCLDFGACKPPNTPETCGVQLVDRPFGTECSVQECSGRILHLPDVCGADMLSGQCIDSGTKDCGPFYCSQGDCLTGCSLFCPDPHCDSVNCDPTAYCDGVEKVCHWKMADGKECTANAQCLSGNCVDGVCCNTICSGLCADCNLPGTAGTCTPVPAGLDPRGECASAGPCGGTCNALGKCVAAGPGDPCGTCRACSPAVECVPVTNGTSCDPVRYCTVGDTCQAGICVAGPGNACDDSNPCTEDLCDEQLKQCTNEKHADHSGCDDGDACNGEERCFDGVCTAGRAVVCDDGRECTDDYCVSPEGVCAYDPVTNGTACNTDVFCWEGMTCQYGSCTGGDARACPSTPCTIGYCDEMQRKCREELRSEGIICETDMDYCDGYDYCQVGVCIKAEPINCDDANPCTNEICTEKGCLGVTILDGTPCSDGNACNGLETCSQGTCRGGRTLVCNDRDDCTSDSCDPLLGCVYSPIINGGRCSTKTVCGGTCQNGMCTGGDPISCDDANPCTADQCEGTSCVREALDNGTGCDDFDSCTRGTVCLNGMCVGGQAVGCDDDNPCTNDSCDSSTGCAHAPNTETCDDGDPCTINDKCADGMCMGETDPACTRTDGGTGVVDALDSTVDAGRKKDARPSGEPEESSSCSCRVGGGSGKGLPFAPLTALFVLLVLRRRVKVDRRADGGR
ncbi:MAG: kelch repeat-containing protein [Pseudomonadota bacterium]